MRKLTDAVARAELQRYGSVAAGPYAGLGAQWASVCDCGAMHDRSLKAARRTGWAHANCPQQVKRTRKLPDDVVRKVMLAARLLPLDPYVDSKAPWRCECRVCGAVVRPSYNRVQQRGRGCRPCGIAARARKRRHDPLEMEAIYRRAGGVPDGDYPGLEAPWPGRCADCHRRPPTRTLKGIMRSGYFCTFCSGKRVDPAVAVAAMEAAGATPLEPFTRSEAPWPCQCHRCHRTIRPMYSSIQGGQGPCIYCSGNAVDPLEARAVIVEAGVLPTGPYPGSDEPWPGVCMTCQHDVDPRLHNVARGHHPCDFCSGNRVRPTDALALLAEHDLEPLEPFAMATVVWLSRCLLCEGIARPVLSRLSAAGVRGCPVCQRSGFRTDEPASVYLAWCAELNVYKVGIANNIDGRLAEHARGGFVPVMLSTGPAVWAVATGGIAKAVEDEVLLELWKGVLRLTPALTCDQMRQRGWTETARLTSLELELTVQVLTNALEAAGDPDVAARMTLT